MVSQRVRMQPHALFHSKSRSVSLLLRPRNHVVLGEHEDAFVPIEVEEPDGSGHQRSIESYSQRPDSFQPWFDIRSQRTKQRSWHQKFRCKQVCFHFHWAPPVISHLFGGANEKL